MYESEGGTDRIVFDSSLFHAAEALLKELNPYGDVRMLACTVRAPKNFGEVDGAPGAAERLGVWHRAITDGLAAAATEYQNLIEKARAAGVLAAEVDPATQRVAFRATPSTD
jgi:hypothetical protein